MQNGKFMIVFFLLTFFTLLNTYAQSTGDLSVTVRNTNNNTVSNATVRRYNENYGYLDYKTTNSSGVALWSGIPANNYYVEAYNTGTFFGEEFWASDAVTVTASTTTNKTLKRNYPYAGNVVIKNDATGAVITSGQNIPIGTKIRAEVTVYNYVPGTDLGVAVRFLFDVSQTSPYDYDSGLSSKQTISGSGGTKTFTFTYTPQSAGQYYYALEVKTTLANGNTTRTDSWNWTKTLNVLITNLQLIVSPADQQTKDWGQSVTYTITVADQDYNRISGATVLIDDALMGQSAQTDTTNSNGETTYRTTVPNGKPNNTYAIKFTGTKSGYGNSTQFTRYVAVSHQTQEADLAVSNLSFSPQTINPNEHPNSVSYRLTNYGPNNLTITTDERVVRNYYISKNSTFGDGDDIDIGAYNNALDLKSGSFKDFNLSSGDLSFITIPSNASGDYYVFLQVNFVVPSTLTDPISSNNIVMRSGTIHVPGNESGWTDNFENYTAGTFPSNWVADGNATDISTNYVDNTHSYEGLSSLKLFGVIGYCWGALAYRPISVNAPFEVELAVKNGDESTSGCHPNRAGIGLREGTSWVNPSRSFINFNKDGSIQSGGGNVDLGTYSTLTWYTVKILYERPSASEVKLSYWINGNYKGSETLPAISDENQLTNLNLAAGEGTAWFDDIVVSSTGVTSIKQKSDEIPTTMNLYQNYPNPFNPVTIINYSVPEQSFVNISVYDVLGEKILTLVNEVKRAGIYEITFDGSELTSGTYFYRMISKNFSETKKLILLK